MRHLKEYWFYYTILILWVIAVTLLVSEVFTVTTIEIGLTIACLLLVIPLVIEDIRRMHT